jgi:cell division protein FtsB
VADERSIVANCPSCGKPTSGAGKFCEFCGFDLSTTPPSAPTAQPEVRPQPHLPSQATGTRAASSRTMIIAFVVVILVLAAGFGYYFVTASGQISSLNQTLTSQSEKISAQAAEIASDTSRISALNASVTSLNAKVVQDQAAIASLTAGFTQANQTIASLDDQITTLQTTIASDNAQIATLQAQVSMLTAITQLENSVTEAGPSSYSTSGTGSVVTFTATYAGYVSVTMTVASDYANEGINMNDTYSSSVGAPSYWSYYDYPQSGYFWAFGSVPYTMVFPVVPGTVTVYLFSSDLTAQTATLMVNYYY